MALLLNCIWFKWDISFYSFLLGTPGKEVIFLTFIKMLILSAAQTKIYLLMFTRNEERLCSRLPPIDILAYLWQESQFKLV